MRTLRALAFNTLFIIWSLLVFVATVVTFLLPRRTLVRAAEIWATGVVVLMKAVLGLRVRIEGRENLPSGGYILASKHQSAIDTILLHLMVDDPAIVLKKELLRIPLYGRYAKRLGMLPVDRSGGVAALKDMLDGARNRLEAGRAVVIYPEGTRREPASPPDYKSGVVMMYRQLGVPVVPVALNTGLFWGRKWRHREGGTLTVRILPAIPSGLDKADFQSRLVNAIETETANLGA
ncbi:MAG: 1-acyl-sn-glycerol-3-phosphate acyltransferase [Proteobacteria bacterium]|nr:1-acyl-sn-glycerol-3-phosphate acyltransferase [Pseudomonadota bacterium]